MRWCITLLAFALLLLNLPEARPADKPPEGPTLARVVVTGINQGGATSSLFIGGKGKRTHIEVSSQIFKLSDKSALLVVINHKGKGKRTLLNIGKTYAAQGRLVVEGPGVETGPFRLWTEGMLAVKDKKRVVLLADSITLIDEKNKASFPAPGKAVVEGKAVCGKRDLKLTAAPTLSISNGKTPIVFSGKKAETDAAGKGVIRATGALSVDAKWLIRLDAEALETGIKLSAARLVEDAIEALGGSLERDKGGLVVGVSLASADVTDAALAHLKTFPKVERLDLSDSRVTDEGMAAVKGLGELQSLALARTAITDKGLAQLKGLTKLRELAFDETKVTDAGLKHLEGLTKLETLALSKDSATVKGLEALNRLPALKSLSLQNNQIDDAILGGLVRTGLLRMVSSARRLKEGRPTGLEEITSLNLRSAPVTDAGLEHLKGLKNLKTLDLTNTKVGDAGLAHLKGLDELVTLYLYGTKVKGPGLENLSGLKKLNSLLMSNSQLTDQMIAALVKANKLHAQSRATKSGGRPAGITEITSLTLSETPITDAGLAHLKGAVNLQTLNLYKTQVKGPGLENLKGLTKLTSLYVSNTQITDDTLGALIKANKLHALSRATKFGDGRPTGLADIHYLNLLETPITDAGLKHLTGLTNLQSLNLQKAKVKGPGLAHLKGLTKLNSLYLSNDEITDDALAALVKADQLHALSRATGGPRRPAKMADVLYLTLEGTAITDAGLAHLKGLTGLISLNLRNTAVSDAGLKHLKGLTKLRVVVLHKTKVTAGGADELQKALPKVKIYR
jgi:Leucine-rich repeat (LRR) protein